LNGSGQQALGNTLGRESTGGFDTAFALKHSRIPSVRKALTVRLLGDRRQVAPEIQKRLVELARYEPNSEVRSQIACSVRRLPGGDAMPIVHELLQHDEDYRPSHSLLLWWAIENKAISDRQTVGRDVSMPATPGAAIIARKIMHRLAQRYASEGTAADLEIAASLLAKRRDNRNANASSPRLWKR